MLTSDERSLSVAAVMSSNVKAEAGPVPDWRVAAIAEYQAHRAEVLADGQGQQQTLAFGATAVGILAAGAFNIWDERAPATAAFLGAIPLLCVLILVQWSGRTFGMMRVGAYLELLEDGLRAGYDRPPASLLTWERKLAQNRPAKLWQPHHGWNDFGAFSIFVALAAGSIGLGCYRGFAINGFWISVLVAIELVVLLTFAVLVALNLSTVRQRARQTLGGPQRPKPNVKE